ncbi:hypothetical protein D3C73_1010150 [compost metagenome]
MLERHALVILFVADALVDEHLGNGRRQLAAMIAADQVQHHVHRRGAAGAGESVAVEGEQARAQADAWEGLLHGRQALPVHAAFVAVEQARLGQRPTAGADAAQPARLTCQRLEPGGVLPGDHSLDAHAAADDDRVSLPGVVPRGIRGDWHAVAGPDLFATGAEGVPAVEFLTGQLIGHAQGFDGGRQGDQGELIEQQETDRLGRFVIH